MKLSKKLLFTGLLIAMSSSVLADGLSSSNITPSGQDAKKATGWTRKQPNGPIYETNSGDNVGIGTTSPTSLLEVNGIGSFGGYATNTNGGINTLNVINQTDAAPSTSGTATNGLFRLSSNSTAVSIDMGVKLTGAYSWIQSRARTDYSTNYSLVLNPNGGNIGIGTTSPSLSLVQISSKGNETNGGTITLDNPDTTLTAGQGIGVLDFYSRDASTDGTGIGAEIMGVTEGAAGRAFGLAFSTRNGDAGTALGERVRIDKSGNVGIGTTAPLSILHVNGGINSYLLAGDTTNSTAKQGGMTITQYGSTAEPEGYQALFGYSYDASHNQIYFGGGVNTQNAATDLHFYTAANATTRTGTERMVIDNGGNVGIGVTNPGTTLEVDSTYRTITGDQAGDAQVNMAIMTTDAAATDQGGILGLGGLYSGSNKLVFGAISGRKELSNDGYLSLYSYKVSTGLVEGIRLTSVGNVGIGSTAPTQKLDVNGTINGTGFSAAGTVGITTTGASCAITAIKNGLVTGGTCV